MKNNFKTITLLFSLIILQGCSSLNEAAGKFNRSVLDPIIEKIDVMCGSGQSVQCDDKHYRANGYFSIYDGHLKRPIWHKPRSADGFFKMCEGDRFSCGQKHYKFHPNWELQNGVYHNIAYGKKHLKAMQEFAEHTDSYNEVIKTGTQICKVNQGFKSVVGYTEIFIKESDKIQIRLKSNGFLIWDTPTNWYACK